MAENTLSSAELALQNGLDPRSMPQHVAIIMDGNGRWARSRSMPRVFGHRKGADSVREVVRCSGEIGLKHLTLFAFSDENWKRPSTEVGAIMRLLKIYLNKERRNLNKNNVVLRTIGNLERLPSDVRDLLEQVREELSDNTGLVLTIALSYGARNELVRATQTLAQRVKSGELEPEEITASHVQGELYTSEFPELDLLIRTSGELRISNFLLWQLAYAELYFTDTLWPDFGDEDFYTALRSYQTRQRRFGEVDELGSEDDVGDESMLFLDDEAVCSSNEL